MHAQSPKPHDPTYQEKRIRARRRFVRAVVDLPLGGSPQGNGHRAFPRRRLYLSLWIPASRKIRLDDSGRREAGNRAAKPLSSGVRLPSPADRAAGQSGETTHLALLASYVTAFYFLFGWLEKSAKSVFPVVASLAVFWAAANAVYFNIVGDFMGYQVFASVFDTHAQETREFLVSAFFRTFALRLAVLLAIIWGLCRLMGGLVAGATLLPASLVKAAALSILLATIFHLPRSRSLAVDFYPLREARHMTQYFCEVHFLVRDYRNLEHRFDGNLDRTREPTVILLIGEAARRDKMGIYGSGLATTPCLEEFARDNPDHLLLFTDAVAASSYTRVSVPSLLSVCPAREFGEIARRPSILRILKSAGLESVLVSNQPKRGFHDNLISAFMEDAARKTYLEDRGKLFDLELVPPLLRELERPSRGARLITLHLAGSHFAYQDNYPPDQAFFPASSIENHYLNSIRYTDAVMRRINRAVMEADRPVVLLYTSDHGEYLNDFGDGFYDHGNRNHLTRFEIEIPFLVTFNRRFLEQWGPEVARMRGRPARAVSHDNISHTLLGLMGVADAQYRPQYDLSSPAFVENRRFIVERTNTVTPLEKVRFDQTRFTGRLD